MRKIIGGILWCGFLIFSVSPVLAQDSVPDTLAKDEIGRTFGDTRGTAKIETLPNGAVAKAGTTYFPKPADDDVDSSCDSFGGQWTLAIENDREKPVTNVEDNQLYNASKQFSKHFAGDGLPETSYTYQYSKPLGSTDYVPRDGAKSLTPAYSETGRWWRCGYSNVLYPEDGTIDVNALVLQAIDQIALEPPTFKIGPNKDMLYVQTTNMHAVDSGDWRVHTATASAGSVTVTATLTPVQTRWDSGEPDKQPVICNGPGKMYEKGLQATPVNYPCSTTYSWATPTGKTYPMTVSIVFEVTATSNIGELGPFPNVVVSTTEELNIKELQAVVVPNQ